MKLVNVDSNFSVESLKLGNKIVEFVHDTKTGSNYFNQKTMVDLFGVSVGTISHHLNNYLESLENNSNNIRNVRIKLKTDNVKQRVSFYGFNAVTYLAFKINTPEAIELQNQISSVLDRMFNVVTGRDSMNTNKDWLRNQCEVKQLQASNAKSASKLLYDVGLKNEADKIYSTYKRTNAEALKFKEMYIDYERLDREVATVRNVKSEQLKLI